MITTGQSITNRVTGERLVFRTTSADTNGERVVVETFVEPNGEVYIEFPPSNRVLRATMQEVQRATKEDITINIFMLERSYGLRKFVTEMARSNKGRVFFTSADQLGEYLLIDYLTQKFRPR